MKHTWGKNNKTVKEYWKQVWKIKKMAAETRRICFGFQRRFLGIFFSLATPHGLRSNSKENKKPNFYHIPLLKADERWHDIRWYCSRFLQTLVVIFPRKSTQVKIHTKWRFFGCFFSAKNLVKSDKLALVEGKILNLMFFDINIPVVPIEIWLRVTHNQRQKTLKIASVLLFRHIFKTKSWLKCGSSLLNSRMWTVILRDAS